MRILAVDYGDARTGMAVSDLSNTMPGEAWVFSGYTPEKVAEHIVSETAARNVGTIVLGYPKNMDGTAGPRAEKSEALAEIIRGLTDVPVVMWDERRTTVDAHRILTETGKRGKKRKKTVDAVAATLILEGYLNSLRNAVSDAAAPDGKISAEKK
ncbi:MAG: Holliday junction resolvase RuvX [Oscillospiraceae bacterium]|nr:Holliday junction resolvase RuvX [Oscillospiraceae bacterium]